MEGKGSCCCCCRRSSFVVVVVRFVFFLLRFSVVGLCCFCLEEGERVAKSRKEEKERDTRALVNQ